MLNERNSSALFCDYYKQWIEVYKKDAIREATLAKCLNYGKRLWQNTQ